MAHGPGSGYQHALVIDDDSSEQRVAQACEILEQGAGIVMLGTVLALRPGPAGIQCEVVDPAPSAHRCAEEFKVLVENAARRLGASKLANRLPRRPARWLVVEDRGSEIVELWAVPNGARE